jgi:hypothetical protein
MRFNVGGVHRIQAGFRINASYQSLLSITIGNCDTIGLAILVTACVADDGSNGITVSQSVVQGLQDDTHCTFSSSIAIGTMVE